LRLAARFAAGLSASLAPRLAAGLAPWLAAWLVARLNPSRLVAGLDAPWLRIAASRIASRLI